MSAKRYLFTPGPTPVPPEVLAATAEPIVHHRGSDFRVIYERTLTRLRDVYRYDWRIWMLPETRDALLDAGFRRVDVLWEGFDDKGEGNGIFRRVKRAENEDSWVAYLLAWA